MAQGNPGFSGRNQKRVLPNAGIEHTLHPESVAKALKNPEGTAADSTLGESTAKASPDPPLQMYQPFPNSGGEKHPWRAG